MKIIKTFTNKEDGLKSIVFNHFKGFAVRLVDTDAGESLSMINIFPKKDEAIDYAKVCAGLKEYEGTLCVNLL